MNKRLFLSLAFCLFFIAAYPVQAYDLSKFSNREAVTAFRTTLQKGVDAAIPQAKPINTIRLPQKVAASV